jgi:hypothetical protein
MQLFILGVLLVFAKVNLQFLDTGVFFYLSNAVGYILMYVGLRSLSQVLPSIKRIQPLVIFMMFHSIGFTLLNGTGHSIKTISLSTGLATILVLSLALLAVAGMLMIFYILHQLILTLRNEEDYFSTYSRISSLEKFLGLFILLLVVTGVLFFVLPAAANVAMLLLLVGELLFIFNFSARVKTV